MIAGRAKIPSMVTMLDFLLMFLFVILIRGKKEEYKLIFPQEPILNNFAIQYSENNSKYWVRDFSIPDGSYNFRLTCDNIDAPWMKRYRNLPGCSIHIFGDLAQDVSNLIFQACATKNCGNLYIPFNASGKGLRRDDIISFNPHLAGREMLTFFN